jgi:cell shape-determining protein MreC
MSTPLQRFFLISIFTTMSIFIARAQSPKQEVVVQAASATTAAPAAPAAAAQPDSSGITTAIKALEELKAKNDEILSKQEATLQRLDELQQAAEQLRIFSKRG